MSAFGVSVDDQAVITIEVDELDILSISREQTATVVFDAIPDSTFEGHITRVATSPTASVGVAKYAVDVTVPKSPSMRVGMNATATIQVGQRDAILTLPLDALQESAGRVFVYTSVDDRTGALSGERDVKTGVSDGIHVEIADGLLEGETVYYAQKSSDDMYGPGGFGPGSGGGGNRQGGF